MEYILPAAPAVRSAGWEQVAAATHASSWWGGAATSVQEHMPAWCKGCGPAAWGPRVGSLPVHSLDSNTAQNMRAQWLLGKLRGLP